MPKPNLISNVYIIILLLLINLMCHLDFKFLSCTYKSLFKHISPSKRDYIPIKKKGNLVLSTNRTTYFSVKRYQVFKSFQFGKSLLDYPYSHLKISLLAYQIWLLNKSFDQRCKAHKLRS